MSYIKSFVLAEFGNFRARVLLSSVAAAVAIANEADDPSHVAKSTKRKFLATSVLTNPQTYVEAFARVASVSGAIATAANGAPDAQSANQGITDAQIDTAVASVWDSLAGVRATD